jgi:hypothetical protein
MGDNQVNFPESSYRFSRSDHCFTVENVSIPRGSSEFQFSHSRYTFQHFDTCFTVLVDFEGTIYPVDASRKFCAKPVGWTLRP